MRLPRALGLCLIVAMPMLAGCGSSGGAASAGSVVHPATFPSGKPADIAPKQAVLRQADVDTTWVVVPQRSGPAGFAEVSKGDPPSLKALERKSFKGAYETLFANAQQEVVLSVAASFARPVDAARVARTWAKMVPHGLQHPTRLRTPAGSPDQFTWWKGTADVSGSTTPAVVAQWVSGKLVIGLFMVGASASPKRLGQFVQRQNAKILGAAR